MDCILDTTEMESNYRNNLLLEMASSKGHLNLVMRLLDFDQVRNGQIGPVGPLARAAMSNRTEVMEYLLNNHDEVAERVAENDNQVLKISLRGGSCWRDLVEDV